MFKVGDVVRIMAKPPADKDMDPGWRPWMNQTCGTVGVITEPVSTDRPHVRVGNWWYAQDWVERVDSHGHNRDQTILSWQQTEQNMKSRRDELLRKIFGG